MRYGEAFWRQGPKTFSEEAWKRIKSRVEIKERRLNEVWCAEAVFVALRRVACGLYYSVLPRGGSGMAI